MFLASMPIPKLQAYFWGHITPLAVHADFNIMSFEGAGKLLLLPPLFHAFALLFFLVIVDSKVDLKIYHRWISDNDNTRR
jgi:hypothetical protein